MCPSSTTSAAGCALHSEVAYSENDASNIPIPDEQSLEASGSAVDENFKECDEVDDGDSDGASITSSVIREQEEYETLKEKASELLHELHPTIKQQDFQLEQIDAIHNDIFGFTIDVEEELPISAKDPWKSLLSRLRIIPKPHGSQKRIISIPPGGAKTMDYEIANLEFARMNVPHLVSEVKSYDLTENNPLGGGYMIQDRLPGQPLNKLWGTLNQSQRMDVAQQLIKIQLDLEKITSKTPGILSASNTAAHLRSGPPKLETFAVPGLGADNSDFGKPATSPATPTTTKDLLFGMCDRWEEYEIACHDGIAQDEIWTGFRRIISTLHELDMIPDEDQFHFCHMELQAYNMVAQVTSQSTVEISGINEWNSAIFAPKFFTHRAPYILWENEDAIQDDENLATMIPEDDDKLELKKFFEKTVSPEYLECAYGAEFILAKRMFRVMLEGIYSEWSMDDANEIIREFHELHPRPTSN